MYFTFLKILLVVWKNLKYFSISAFLLIILFSCQDDHPIQKDINTVVGYVGLQIEKIENVPIEYQARIRKSVEDLLQ